MYRLFWTLITLTIAVTLVSMTMSITAIGITSGWWAPPAWTEWLP